MERVLLAVGIALVVFALALLLQRRRPDPPSQRQWAVPAQVDRADFQRPGAPWLVAVFSSSTCDACAAVLDRAQTLTSADVVVEDVEFNARRDLHQRYNIETVPMLVIADRQGVVRGHFIGTPTEGEVESAFAQLTGAS
jgi:thioredoxin-related protein